MVKSFWIARKHECAYGFPAFLEWVSINVESRTGVVAGLVPATSEFLGTEQK
jgi:hypothetical protein